MYALLSGATSREYDVGKRNDYKNSTDKRRTDGRAGGSLARGDEFINLELDAAQADECRAFRKDPVAVNLILTEMLEDGYKITCRYDSRNECYACFAFAEDDSDNAGYILTGRGGSGMSALAELLYKHAQVLERSWVRAAERTKRRYTDED
jgi:hypothetical protein